MGLIYFFPSTSVVTGVFCSAPYRRQAVYSPHKCRYETYNHENAVHRSIASHDRVRRRYMFRFYIPDKGMKILDGGNAWFAVICEARRTYADFYDQIFKIHTVNGLITVTPICLVSDELRVKIARCRQLNLRQIAEFL